MPERVQELARLAATGTELWPGNSRQEFLPFRLLEMGKFVAGDTKGDQIPFSIVSIVSSATSRDEMVHLEVGSPPTTLTAPAITPQDLLTQFSVRFWVKS
jgi:hypothetical protein